MFRHRLAITLGCFVTHIDNHMPANELDRWRVFLEQEPQGESRADFRMGQICAVIANSHRRKSAKSYRWSDFVPDFRSKRRAKGDYPDAPTLVAKIGSVLTNAFGRPTRAPDGDDWATQRQTRYKRR